jgi:hypothetical protein
MRSEGFMRIGYVTEAHREFFVVIGNDWLEQESVSPVQVSISFLYHELRIKCSIVHHHLADDDE